MEYIPDASKLTNLEQIEAKGLSRKAVGKSVAEVFASQIFDMGFVQADGHPRYEFLLCSSAWFLVTELEWLVMYWCESIPMGRKDNIKLF